MRKLTLSFAVFMFCAIGAFLVPEAHAQAGQVLVPQSLSTVGSNLSMVAGNFVANNYNYTGAQIYTGNAATGSATITVRAGYVVLPDGRHVVPFAVGVPFVINDTTPEMVTPTAVSGCYNARGMNQDGVLVTCSITATFSFTHGIGASITTATGGLAEAANDAYNWGGGVVMLAPGFFVNTSCTNCFTSANAAIAGILPYGTVAVEDARSGSPTTYWASRPNGTTPLASGSAPTIITGTGGLNSGAYRVEYQYVDVNGQLGTTSTESAQSATTTQVAFAAPAASAGAVGYVVNITAAAGGANSETNFPVTAANCTLTKIESIIPACAVTNATYGQVGSAFTTGSAANNATTTFKGIGAGTATDTSSISRTVYSLQPVGSYFPLPFQSTITAQTTQAAGNATYEVASWNLSSSFFNNIGHKYQLHYDAHATGAANSETVTINVYYGPYNNSDTKICSVGATGAFSAASGQVVFFGDFYITPTVTGATGSISCVGTLDAGLAGTSVDTRIISTQAVVTGSLPLTTQQQLRFEVVQATGAFGSVVTFDDIQLAPID